MRIPLSNATLMHRIFTINSMGHLGEQHDALDRLVTDIKAHGLTDHPRSVLQPWVMDLPLREQGCLMTAVRGCDLTPKRPLDSLERRIVAAIRGGFMVAADPRETDSEPGSFMSLKIPDAKTEKLSTLGHYPLHWVVHVMHACEVLGYRHPDTRVLSQFQDLYREFCHMLHVPAETFETYAKRMTEDRIAAGNVVS